MSRPRHVLVLGDQLNRSVGPLASAVPGRDCVLMIESETLARGLPHHKQKLGLVFSAMRHFAEELRNVGFEVDYRRAQDFEAGMVGFLEGTEGVELEMMRPTDWGYEPRLRAAAERGGGRLKVFPNELWITTAEEFDEWAEGRETLRLEYFYREVRKKRGWLMDGDEPLGGSWNYDEENRKTPEQGHDFPNPIRFGPDELTRSVLAEVESEFGDHFGSLEGFSWPVTRREALDALDDFLERRLGTFGPFEDAIVEGEPVLYHSLLSVPLNLGLLTAQEVCERALEHADRHEVALPSIEGFVRQVAGWREFMRHVYRRMMPGLREANGLEHDMALPDVYWGGPTKMRCIRKTVAQVMETGHTHHIQRLMILGNLALVARVDPRELNDWFLASYVDALDWVVTPNVMGMSQYADLGSFTSKPYAASANYIDRMSDHCGRCAFDRKKTVGKDACPFNSLYWSFIDHHAERFSRNHRMALMVRNWERRDEEDRLEILERAEEVRQSLNAGAL